MGRGGAQLGKPLKGAGVIREADGSTEKAQVLVAASKEVQDEVETLEAYERYAMIRRAHVETMISRARAYRRGKSVNTSQTISRWQDLLRHVKRHEMHALAQSRANDFQRSLDVLEAEAMNEISTSKQMEGIRKRSYRQNASQLERLMTLQRTKIAEIGKKFEHSLLDVTKEFDKEFKIVKSDTISVKSEMKALELQMRLERQEYENTVAQRIETEREGIRNRNLETINSLRIALDRFIEELEHRFDVAHHNYVDNTDERTKDFQLLTERDRELSLEIERKIRRIDHCQAEMTTWRKKLGDNARECSQRNKKLRAEREALANHYFVLKRHMNKFRDGQTRHLKALSRSARKTTLTCRERISTGSTIVKLAELARQRELDHERLEMTRSHDDLLLLKQDSKEEVVNQMKTEFGEWGYFEESGVMDGDDKATEAASLQMGSYVTKFNEALISLAMSREERDRVRDENEKLKDVLRQYLGAINVSPAIVDAKNTLMVINGKHNIVRSLPPRKTPAGVVEGNIVVNTYAAQHAM